MRSKWASFERHSDEMYKEKESDSFSSHRVPLMYPHESASVLLQTFPYLRKLQPISQVISPFLAPSIGLCFDIVVHPWCVTYGKECASLQVSLR